MNELKVGDRVKHGESVIRGKRDYWLGRGDSRSKSAAKQWLDDAVAQRGTVEALGETKYGKYVQVKWDHLPNTESRCLPYLVTKAD